MENTDSTKHANVVVSTPEKVVSTPEEVDSTPGKVKDTTSNCPPAPEKKKKKKKKETYKNIMAGITRPNPPVVQKLNFTPPELIEATGEFPKLRDRL